MIITVAVFSGIGINDRSRVGNSRLFELRCGIIVCNRQIVFGRNVDNGNGYNGICVANTFNCDLTGNVRTRTFRKEETKGRRRVKACFFRLELEFNIESFAVFCSRSRRNEVDGGIAFVFNVGDRAVIFFCVREICSGSVVSVCADTVCCRCFQSVFTRFACRYRIEYLRICIGNNNRVRTYADLNTIVRTACCLHVATDIRAVAVGTAIRTVRAAVGAATLVARRIFAAALIFARGVVAAASIFTRRSVAAAFIFARRFAIRADVKRTRFFGLAFGFTFAAYANRAAFRRGVLVFLVV